MGFLISAQIILGVMYFSQLITNIYLACIPLFIIEFFKFLAGNKMSGIFLLLIVLEIFGVSIAIGWWVLVLIMTLGTTLIKNESQKNKSNRYRRYR